MSGWAYGARNWLSVRGRSYRGVRFVRCQVLSRGRNKSMYALTVRHIVLCPDGS